MRRMAGASRLDKHASRPGAHQPVGPGQHRMRVCLELPDGSQLRQRAVVWVLLLQPGRRAAAVSECKRGTGRARRGRALESSSRPD